MERLLPLACQSQVTLATGDLLEVLVRGGPRYLGQMLTNLVEKGIKYSSGIGKRVYVELACEEGCWGVVRLLDDGPGISEENLPYVFERFYRVDKARSRELGGTGLGLSIVKHLVAAHNGAIRVESSVGHGSTFFFTLPVEEAALNRADLNPELTTP